MKINTFPKINFWKSIFNCPAISNKPSYGVFKLKIHGEKHKNILTLSHSHTLSLSHSHSHTLTLTQSFSLSLSDSLTLDILNNFCFNHLHCHHCHHWCHCHHNHHCYHHHCHCLRHHHCRHHCCQVVVINFCTKLLPTTLSDNSSWSIPLHSMGMRFL